MTIDAELDALTSEFDRLCLAQEIQSGLVPAGVRRAMTDEERDAGVDFVAIENETTAEGKTIADELIIARSVLFQLLQTDLQANTTSVASGITRIQELMIKGLADVDGVARLVTENARDIRSALDSAVYRAGERVVQEAAIQGVELSGPDGFDGVIDDELDQQANRLAVVPHVDALRAVAEAVVQLPKTAAFSQLTDVVAETGQSLSEQRLETLARQSAQSAVGLGRIAVAESQNVQPFKMLASELLDRNTCDPCFRIDKHVYKTMAELRRDYPAGIYVHCQGGMSCRGFPLFIWQERAT